jgi:Cysteine rich repeat
MGHGKRIRRLWLLPLLVACCCVLAANSPAHSTPVVKGQTQVPAAVAGCQPDVARLCAHVSPGGGRIIQCLADRSDRLSPACRDILATAKTLLGR